MLTPEIFENPVDPNPLVQLFEAKKIRIFGTVEEPLFCAIDVAAHIDDRNVDRIFEELLKDGYACWQIMHVAVGDARKTLFLTELGLYRYLLKTKMALAQPFQDYTYELIAEERKKIVDSVKLALKIEKTNCANIKREEETTKVICSNERKEKYDFIRAANIARDENREVEAKIAAIEKEKAGLDAFRARAAGISVEEDPSSDWGTESDDDDLGNDDYPGATKEDVEKENLEYEREKSRRDSEKYCQLREIEFAELEEIMKAEAEEKEELPNPLIAIFEEKNIRISGTVYKPLFHSTDVAQYIHDKQCARIFRDQIPEKYMKWVLLKDGLGRIQNTRFLTEQGLYRYLLQTDCKKADNFQKYTYDLLRTHRKKIVDDFRLAVKIQQARTEELRLSRSAARKIHKKVRIEFNEYITAANISRDKLRVSKKKLEEMEEEWVRTTEKTQIEHYWSPFVAPERPY